jgi:hypothetical protein
MAATFGDSNGGEGPTKWNTKPIKRATDDELKRARSVLAPLENNHDCSRDGCDGAARDGSTHHYSHRASSPDQHQYHDPGSPPQQLADNITTLVTVPHTDISTSSTKQQSDNNITGDEINLVCGEEIPASPLPTPPSPIQTFLDEKVEDCIKPTTTTTAATTTSTDTTSAALTSKVNLSRCRKISNSPTQLTLQQDLSPLSSFFPGTYNYVPVAVLEPHSPPGTPPPPSTTSPTSETPSGITIYRVAPGEEEEESDNEQEDLEDGELPAQDDDDTTLEERATAPK